MFANRPVGIDFEEVAASSASEIPALPTPTSSSSGARQAIEELSGLTTAPQARPPPSSVGNVGSGKPQADFALLEATNGVVEYPLPIARFQNTTSVSIVFVSRLLVAHLARAMLTDPHPLRIVRLLLHTVG